MTTVFRWIKNSRGGAYCERALKEMPNHNAHLTIEEHALSMDLERLDLDQLAKLMPFHAEE